MYNAVPYLIDVPNPPPNNPYVNKRPPPRDRMSPPPSKRQKKNPEPEPEPTADVASAPESPAPSSLFTDSECDAREVELMNIKRQLIEMDIKHQSAVRNVNNLKKKVGRLEKRLVKCSKANKELRRELQTRQCSIEEVLKNFPPVPQALFRILLKNAKRVNWIKEKEAVELSLSVYFRSPSAYKALRGSGFLLPHPSTLRRRIGKVLIKPGICPAIQDMMRIRALSLQEHEKCVTLALDGMTLTPGLQYKPHSDTCLGHVDHGPYGHEEKLANQGVVMMVRGLSLKWKQVIGFCLVAHNLPLAALNSLVGEAVDLLKQSGFTVKMLVMDQEATQWSWMKTMHVSVERPFLVLSETCIYAMPDPPHLIKNLRNNFMSKNIHFNINGEAMIACWQHCVMLWELERVRPVKAIPKWSDAHFDLKRGGKMKVTLAVQVFSHSAATGMRMYVAADELPQEALQTAAFLEEVNAMWDFVNSSSPSGPPAKRAVALAKWSDAAAKFARFMEFVSSWSFVLPNGKTRQLPSHDGWRLALSALQHLCEELVVDKKVMSYLCLRKCNQDHVENLHSLIRGNSGHNDHPMSQFYISALRILACSFQTTELLALSDSSNCEADDDHVFLDTIPSLNTVTECSDACRAPVECVGDASGDNVINVSGIENLPPAPVHVVDPIEENVIIYIAGYVIRKLNTPKACSECIDLCLTNSVSAKHALVSLKEFKAGCMYKVSAAIAFLCIQFEKHFQSSTMTKLPYPHPRAAIVSSFMKSFCELISSLPLNCTNNHKNALILSVLNTYCTLRIHHYVKAALKKSKKGKRGSDLNKCKKLNM
jgi:hypothetical protein